MKKYIISIAIAIVVGIFALAISGWAANIFKSNSIRAGQNKIQTNVTSDTVVNSQKPVISGIDAPTTLNIGQSGTWVLHASDPQNSQLTYRVHWGDEPIDYNMRPGASSVTTAFNKTANITHTYTVAGTYTVLFTVSNAAGLTADFNKDISVR